MNATGCASLTVDASVFFNTKFEDQMQDSFLVNVNVTEEGTDSNCKQSCISLGGEQFVGEAGSYSADMIYMVLSKGVIILHGFQTVKAKAGDSVASGSVTFQLSVSVDMAPAVQIQVYGVPPSENVVASSVPFDTDMCFQNQVSLQFSPGKRSDGSLLPQCCRSEPTDHGARKTSERVSV
ncbi:uncharacterized protein LOC120487905 isoform X2 [Pimephales promelas]|uniref:uncharacterized protein LOC120487905 isoform X2 n=1 Tax=Pimephales promelas TaxID=90988 RepID=UPI0019556E40|nr:uncharacterized protein LOC120487905 isoform X2 [Pimephales promelas]